MGRSALLRSSLQEPMPLTACLGRLWTEGDRFCSPHDDECGITERLAGPGET